MKEIWRPVVGYEGLYEVSNWGRVKSLNYKHTGKEELLNPTKNNIGYFHVVLCKNGKPKWFLVHRLVGMAFPDLVGWVEDVKGKPFEKLEINHKDQNKENNRVENLEWCNRGYNNNYGTHNEEVAKANTNGKKSKIVYQKTLNGEFVKEYPSTMEVQRQTGWSQQSISACCRGKLKSAYGFLWRYKQKTASEQSEAVSV